MTYANFIFPLPDIDLGVLPIRREGRCGRTAPVTAHDADTVLKRIRRDIVLHESSADEGTEVAIFFGNEPPEFHIRAAKVYRTEIHEIAFEGVDSGGRPAQTVQHMSQLSYSFRFVRKYAPPQSIGFHDPAR